MSEFIQMIEPYVVCLSLVLWEVFCGYCLWACCVSDIQTGRRTPSGQYAPGVTSNITHASSAPHTERARSTSLSA